MVALLDLIPGTALALDLCKDSINIRSSIRTVITDGRSIIALARAKEGISKQTYHLVDTSTSQFTVTLARASGSGHVRTFFAVCHGCGSEEEGGEDSDGLHGEWKGRESVFGGW
ncbi:unnamed protein product [Periconia digitata]|uniref:Uncharacterized protein n=1 Tax=Periconia digitata TaxID=1303443 RepID=A0A9W4UID8_9PLEO|nr:unnamed protein product [Periconia digitata]